MINNLYLISNAISNANEEIRLSYKAHIIIYKFSHGKLVKSLAPLGDVILELKIKNKNITTFIRPESFDEFKYYFVLDLENTIVFPAGQEGNITAAIKFKKYLLNQIRTNKTFAEIMYKKYLNSVNISKITSNYIVNNNNYVVNYSEIGFFPLYSIVSLNEKFIKEYKPTYYNSRITTPGIIAESIGGEINYTFIDLPLYADRVKYDGFGPVNTELYFKKNYLVHASNVILPLNKTHYIFYKSIIPTKDTISFLDSVPDYKLTTEDYWVLVLIVSIIVLAGVGVIAWRKRAG